MVYLQEAQKKKERKKKKKVSDELSLPYLPNPSARAGYDIRSIFKRRLKGLNSEISFS